MKINAGDKIEFLGISWNEDWEFDYPTIIISPILSYSPNGTSVEQMFEDLCYNLCIANYHGTEVYDEDLNVEFGWRGWSIDTIKNVIQQRVNGNEVKQLLFHENDIYEDGDYSIREVIRQTVEFFITGDGLDFKIIKTEKF